MTSSRPGKNSVAEGPLLSSEETQAILTAKGLGLPRDVKAVNLRGCMDHVLSMVSALNSEGM